MPLVARSDTGDGTYRFRANERERYGTKVPGPDRVFDQGGTLGFDDRAQPLDGVAPGPGRWAGASLRDDGALVAVLIEVGPAEHRAKIGASVAVEHQRVGVGAVVMNPVLAAGVETD